MNELLNYLPEVYERLRRVQDSEHDPAYLDQLVAHWKDPDNVPLPADPDAGGWESVCITDGLLAWVDDYDIDGKVVGTTLMLTGRGNAALFLWERSQQATHQPDAKAVASVPAATTGKRVTLDARALALYLEDQTRTKTDIANILGVKDTQSLSPGRCPQLDAAMKAYKAVNANDRRKTRGSKGKDGTLEAYAEDE